MLVANHTNGLVDGLLLMATLRRYPRFLGKSTLFKIPPLWPFLKLAGVIPVYRTMDAVPGDHNVSAFATSHDLLRRGGVVAVFPEGISHDQLSLQPLKTGAARIALEAGNDGGVDDVVTVAVGLVYDAKARFRRVPWSGSRNLSVSERWAERYRGESRAAVRSLTGDLAAQLAGVGPTYASWAQADLLARIAEVVVRAPGAQLPADVRWQIRSTWRRGSRQAQQASATPCTICSSDFATLPTGPRPPRCHRSPTCRRLPPPTAPLRCVVGGQGRRRPPVRPRGRRRARHSVPDHEGLGEEADQRGNQGDGEAPRLLRAFVLTYAVVGVIVGRAYGPWAGLVAAVAAPLCGYVAVRLLERVKRTGGLVEGYRAVREHGDVLDSVLAHRAAVVEDAHAAAVAS